MILHFKRIRIYYIVQIYGYPESTSENVISYIITYGVFNIIKSVKFIKIIKLIKMSLYIVHL